MHCVGPTLEPDAIDRLREDYEFAPDLEEEAEWHSVFGHPLRLKILRILRDEGSVCVCDLRDILGTTTSTVSQHLARLKSNRVVSSRRDGQTVFYALTEHASLRWIAP